MAGVAAWMVALLALVAAAVAVFESFVILLSCDARCAAVAFGGALCSCLKYVQERVLKNSKAKANPTGGSLLVFPEIWLALVTLIDSNIKDLSMIYF